MTTCKQCREFEKCKDDAFINGAKFDTNESVKYCTGFEPITNADRIRSMSDEDLLNLLSAPCPLLRRADDKGCPNPKPCRECIEEWLKRPAEVD